MKRIYNWERVYLVFTWLFLGWSILASLASNRESVPMEPYDYTSLVMLVCSLISFLIYFRKRIIRTTIEKMLVKGVI
jgi:hypothetical protein